MTKLKNKNFSNQIIEELKKFNSYISLRKLNTNIVNARKSSKSNLSSKSIRYFTKNVIKKLMDSGLINLKKKSIILVKKPNEISKKSPKKFIKSTQKIKNKPKSKPITLINDTSKKGKHLSKKPPKIVNMPILLASNTPLVSLNTLNPLLTSNISMIQPNLPNTTAKWQYFDNNNYLAAIKSPDHWYDYYPEANKIVEECWQKYCINRGCNDVRSVKSGQFSYMVDFLNWKQTNIVHSNHTVRQIRRLDSNGKVTKNPYVV